MSLTAKFANMGGGAGGGGGGTVVKQRTGIIHGYTDMGAIETSAFGYIDLPDLDGDSQGTIQLHVDATYDRTITLASTDPSDGSTWVNSAEYPVSADLVAAVFAAVIEALSGIAYVSLSGNHADIYVNSFGASSSIVIDISIAGGSAGGGAGTESTPPSGEISSVTFSSPSDKNIQLIRAFVSFAAGFNTGATVEIGVVYLGNFYPFLSYYLGATPGTYEIIPQYPEEVYSLLTQPPMPGAQLVVRFGNDGGIPTSADEVLVGAIWALT